MKTFASFRGIQFPIECAKEEAEWHFEASEFLTSHLPTTERFSKVPETFQIEGFLLGKDALLTKDLLIKATDDETPGKLIHPIFGMRMGVCVGRRFENFGASMNAYRFSLTLKEMFVEQKKNIFTSALSEIEKANDAFDAIAKEFVEAMEPILDDDYLMTRTIGLLKKIDGFLTSVNGFGLFPEFVDTIATNANEASNAIKDILESPEVLFSHLKDGAQALSENPLTVLSLVETIDGNSPVTTAFLFLAIAHGYIGGTLDKRFQEVVNELMTSTKDDRLFVFLWNVSTSLKDVTKPIKTANTKEPSLVRSYLDYGDLKHAEELAHDFPG